MCKIDASTSPLVEEHTHTHTHAHTHTHTHTRLCRPSLTRARCPKRLWTELVNTSSCPTSTVRPFGQSPGLQLVCASGPSTSSSTCVGVMCKYMCVGVVGVCVWVCLCVTKLLVVGLLSFCLHRCMHMHVQSHTQHTHNTHTTHTKHTTHTHNTHNTHTNTQVL